MDHLLLADNRLRAARESFDRDYDAVVAELSQKQADLVKILKDIEEKKSKIAEVNGNVDAADDDLVEVNAGGTIVAAKRSTLVQLKGTRLEALFSGRWDKKLQRDGNDRIFLDVNPVAFRAIVDYLNEMAISSEDDPPSLPRVDDEHKQILRHQLELFGLSMPMLIDSCIIKTPEEIISIHNWIEEDSSGGSFRLLYRSSRDGLSGQNFHSKCDNQGPTITVIETTDGYVLGGYSDKSWTSNSNWVSSEKAFLFVLSGRSIASSCKLKLTGDKQYAIYHKPNYGATFGGNHDLQVMGNYVHLSIGHTYESDQSLPGGQLTIKEVEVFQVAEGSHSTVIAAENNQQTELEDLQIKLTNRFSEDINKAINAKQKSLFQAKAEVLRLEKCYKDEHNFINAFACGNAKDIVTLNVSGTVMATQRSTLCVAENSVLAQQFDDTKWTEQGCNVTCVEEWTSDEVAEWAGSIRGTREDVSSIFKENDISGGELLAFNMEGLKMIGVKRPGTSCLLLKEIKKLEKASQDIVTLIEHSPYCFGKIMDYLRLKRLHSEGLVKEPALPVVCDLQKSRFEKVVKYYFPGESAKFILG